MRPIFLIFLLFSNLLFSSEHHELSLISSIEDGNISMVQHNPDLQKILNRRLYSLSSHYKSKKCVPDFPITLAIYFNNPDMIQVLIDLGAELNPKDNARPPLHVAIQLNNPALFQTLITLGADKNLTDCFGKTPLELAKELNYQEIIDIIFPTPIENKVQEKIVHFSLVRDISFLYSLVYLLFGISFEEYS